MTDQPTADPAELVALEPSTHRVDPFAPPPTQRRPLITRNGRRPWIYTNMIASLDGGIVRDGVSGGLGNPADALVFSALRSHADAIVVGASTANLERYRPASTKHATERIARGQSPSPRIIIVSGRLAVDPDLEVFLPSDDRPPAIVIGSAQADPARARTLAAKAELVLVDDDRLDADGIVAVLGAQGCRACLLEGGPTLNGLFAAADLIDEWNLTLAPQLVAASAGLRPTTGDHFAPATQLRLEHLWRGGDHLFGRWIRDRP